MIFRISNDERVAESTIQNLQQKGSASQYATVFQNYAQRTEWNDESKMAIYRQGLKENVKDELIRYAGRIKSLDKFIQASIEFDNKLYK